ncbi:MAG TPA: phosphatase PAP2 family protein [Bradyrhizobium sp.]
MLTAAVTDKDRFRIAEWLMFADYGALARRNMAVVWSSVAALALVESIWLPMSRLTFDQAAGPALAYSLVYAAVAYAFYVAVAYRLRGNEDRAAALLRAALERFALLFRGCIAIFAIGSVGLVFTYLATAAGLPLQDAFLARLDSDLGFNWPGFLGAVNDHPFWARSLERAYASTAPLTEGIIVWLTIRGNGERLSEFLGLLCLASLGLAIGMVLVPAAGAFVYFAPARHLFDNFAGQGEMWPFLDAFNALRDGSLTKIDLSSVQGVVSFPSFHTMLGILISYALRDTKPLFIAVAAINAMMIVSTLPVGGHYLADVIAGAAICAAAIYGMRREFRGSVSSRPSAPIVGAQ